MKHRLGGSIVISMVEATLKLRLILIIWIGFPRKVFPVVSGDFHTDLDTD